MKIKVRISPQRYGGFAVRPVSDTLTRRICKEVKRNGGTVHKSGTALFDSVEATAGFTLSPSDVKQLDAGWDVVKLADPWEFAHHYGYDAHLVFGQG